MSRVVPAGDAGEVACFSTEVIAPVGRPVQFVTAEGFIDGNGELALKPGAYELSVLPHDPIPEFDRIQGRYSLPVRISTHWGSGSRKRPFSTHEGTVLSETPELHIHEGKPLTVLDLKRVATSEDRKIVFGVATAVIAAGTLALRLTTLRRKAK